jgi:hypothetical protein
MKIGKVAAICTAFAFAITGTAAANDAIQATVTPNTPPTPIVLNNGSGLTPGTYAIGTIQLFYTVQGFEFPTGPFATFDLGLSVAAGKPNPPTGYPVSLTLHQTGTGSSNVNLDPASSTFSVTSAGWSDHTTVTISIPAGAPSTDGTDIEGNLQISAPGGAHLDTVTTVQVHVKLVYPTACLKLYNFITDEAFTQIVSSTNVNVNNRTGKVTSSTPYGQLSDNVLVVNTCATSESFDVMVALDPWFRTNPAGNPGNAVFTYATTGELDPSTFNLAAFGTGTAHGQSLQLTNITVPAGDMFLMTIHMTINKGALWNGGNTGTFSFSAELCVSGTLTLLGGVDPTNPASAILTYTQQ